MNWNEIMLVVLVGWVLNGLCYWTWNEEFAEWDDWLQKYHLSGGLRFLAFIPYSLVVFMDILLLGLIALLIVGGGISYCVVATWKGWKSIITKKY